MRIRKTGGTYEIQKIIISRTLFGDDSGIYDGLPDCAGSGGTSAATQAAADSESASEGVTWSENLLDPANPVTVKFYSYSYASPAFGTGFQTMMDNFNNGIGKEKGVILEFVADDTGTKAETDVKAGQQVDIVQSGFAIIDGNRDNLGISAFEDVFPADEMEAHFEGIPENCLNLGRIDGKMYGLAFTFSTPMLYVNGDLLEEAGLDPTQAPKDWMKCTTGVYRLKKPPENMALHYLRPILPDG